MTNKKGSLNIWVEAIMLSALIVFSVSIIFTWMNSSYSQNQDTNFGLNDSQIFSNFAELSAKLEQGISTGEANFDSSAGLQLRQMWELVSATRKTLGEFLFGSWIPQVVNLVHLPTKIGTVLRILYLIFLALLILKLLFKIKP